jgi:hypothetical protein
MSDSLAATNPLFDYWRDAFERSVLFLDVLRARGNDYREQSKREAPHVLNFEPELIVDGRRLERPVNYALVRIRPPPGVETDPSKRPFIIFDPRAGHGPGIGGMKHDSEIGVALRAGHPAYFVGFTPNPEPGQTIEDVCRAEIHFIRVVGERHADAAGKPVLIGNCQAGWQIMMAATMAPDLPGPMVLAGAPLSYWAGVRGKNPMRYLGGMLGGSWLTSLAGDLGNGIFDGAALIANFESNNPANTFWTKSYNVYSKVDTEAPRFLEFEKWWGAPVLLNAEEIQFIVDELFVGNKLTKGEISTRKSERIDLRKLQSPIIVFCSFGDDITPPQQALGWILDLYEDLDDLIANGQTIIYSLHQSIGHLGIFVSGKVATKEHEEFALNMELIDTLPPGLYELTLQGVDKDTFNRELVGGNYVAKLLPRTLDDIRALGGNDAADERRFQTMAKVSEINRGLYRRFASPVIKAMSTEHSAKFLRETHPNRVAFAAFSDGNPAMRPVEALATAVRAARHPVDPGNPFLAMEKMGSDWIVTGLNAFAAMREAWTEATFLGVYGSRWLQTVVGLSADSGSAKPEVAGDPVRAKRAIEVEMDIERGGFMVAGVRALLYVLKGEGVDERQFNALEALRNSAPEAERVPLSRLRETLLRQAAVLRTDETRAVAAIPTLLSPDPGQREKAMQAILDVISASGRLGDDAVQRLEHVRGLFLPDALGSARTLRLAAKRAG